jgi:uncharacterized protein YlxW (UPF0749 family)
MTGPPTTPAPYGPGAPARPARRPGRPPDASMTLLREVMERPLDPGYAEAAARRRRGERSGGRRRHALTVALAVAGGYLLGVAIVEVRIPTPEVARTSERLREEIQRRTAAVSAQEARISDLRSAIAATQAEALRESGGSALVEQAETLGVVTGELPVRGSGLRLTIDDAPGREDAVGADPRADVDTGAGVVLDSDLQLVVNGLWEAGAEAVAINGQRLTGLSAIRSAGRAILVDFRPLVPPYVIDVVGDPSGLQTGFAASAAGAYLYALEDNSGIKVDETTRDDLRLPAAGRLVLREAKPAPGSLAASPTRSGPASGTSGPDPTTP